MNVDVETLLQETIDRMTTGAGALLVLVFAALGTAKSIAMVEFYTAYFGALAGAGTAGEPSGMQGMEGMAESVTAPGLGFGIGLGPAVVLWLVAAVLSLVVLAIAIDGFAREVDEPGDLGTDRLGWKTANLVAGWIFYTIVVGIGAALLLLPGAVIAILLLFYPVAIVVEDQWVGAALVSSLELFRDHFASALVVSALAVGAFVVKHVLTSALPTYAGAPGQIVAELVGAIYWVFLFALLTRTYVALSDSGAPDVVGDDVDAAGRHPA